jgi:ribonuclease P protein component
VNVRAAKAERRPSDQERFVAAMAEKPCARTEHFMAHHLRSAELSTGADALATAHVDEPAGAFWLGLVVPKRHARRAVTRNLVRRQIRACVDRHSAGLSRGDWVVRLRKGFAVDEFPSASSAALAERVCRELEQLLARVARPAKSSHARAGSA